MTEKKFIPNEAVDHTIGGMGQIAMSFMERFQPISDDTVNELVALFLVRWCCTLEEASKGVEGADPLGRIAKIGQRAGEMFALRQTGLTQSETLQ